MKIDFEKGDGLVPVIIQHFTNGEVLGLGYANAEALQRCQETGELWLYSRKRQQLWHKGETSGNTQKVMSITPDCDNDTLLVRVAPHGPMCHTGERSCFGEAPSLVALADVISDRIANPSDASYTNKLLNDENLRLKKIGEETVELIVACKSKEKEKAAEEAADVIYHVMVACISAGAALDDILARLETRLTMGRGRAAAG